MQCPVCGAALRPTTSDLPFKVRDHTIVILKHRPVLECANCMQYLIADREFSRVEQILAPGQAHLTYPAKTCKR